MLINATLVGELVFVLALFMAAIYCYLGRRKTETPILISIIVFFTAIIPPIALIYLIILAFKRDISTVQSNA